MKYEIDLGKPIENLQFMLRNLGIYHDMLPIIAIDGVFGEETLESVMLFQREFFPPVTGVVTKEVWDKIREEEYKIRPELKNPRKIRLFPPGKSSFSWGDQGDSLFLVQTMFLLLGEYIHGIEKEAPTGEYTTILADNLLWLQVASRIPADSILDSLTWDRLSRLYELYITRQDVRG